MDLFKKVSTQTLWQVLGKIITSVSTLIILGLITRNFGTSGTGVYTLALTYLSFFYLACDLGLNAYLLPTIIEDKKTWNKLLGLRIMWGIFLTVLSFSILPFLPFNSTILSNMVYLGSLTILLNAIYITANAYFQSRLRYDLSTLILGATTLISFVGIYSLGTLVSKIDYLILPHLVGWTAAAILSLILIKRLTSLIKPIFDKKFITQTYLNVWPLALTLILNTLYFRADSFILASFRSFSEVGMYNLPYQLFQSALIIPTFITNAYYPLMIVNLKKNRLKFIKELDMMLYFMLGLSILGGILTWFLAPLIIQLLAGSTISSSVSALRILSLSYPAFFISSVLMWLLVSMKRQKSILLIYSIGLILNIFLNYLFIPQYSFIASTWITVVCEYLILILEIFLTISVLRKS